LHHCCSKIDGERSLDHEPIPIFAADVTGAWKAEFDSQIGLQKYTFTFKEDGTNLTGKASSEAGERKRETQISAPITARRLVFDTAALLFRQALSRIHAVQIG
jgi:hypothetical protein